MKLSNSIILGLLVISNFCYSQSIDFKNYEPLHSIGDLPSDFTQRISEKVDIAIAEKVSTTEDQKTQGQKIDFIIRSNYMIDNLMMSGNVLYGDPVTEYVNKIADLILKDEPELREELRFYCIKSNITNAFTTDQGMIFVSLGLIAQLENEAQLAFILGHEINHFKEDHVINSVVENEKIKASSRSKNRKKTQDETIIALSDYSKTLEMESDSIGFFFSEATGYDLEEVLNSFNILQFSHLPYDEIEFDYSAFELNDFTIPEQYKLDTLMDINFEIDEDDSKRSHPNLTKRRDQISNMLKVHGNSNKGVKYLVSEKDFLDCRRVSRFESIRVDLKNLNFIRAYYNATFLLKNNPNSIYLKESIAKSLYGIAKFKLNKKYYKFADDYDEYEGAISAAYYFFEEMDKHAVSSLAIKKIFEINLENKSEHLSNILDNLITNFLEKNKPEKFNFDKYFLSEIPKVQSDTLEIVEKEEETVEPDPSESKYDKLKRLQKEQDTKVDFVNPEEAEFHRLVYVNYIFRDEIKDLFQKRLEILKEEIKKEDEEQEAYDNMTNREKSRAREMENEERKYNKKTKNNIGAEKVVFVDPQYYTIDERKGVKLENSEDKKYRLYDKLTNIGSKSGVSVDIITPKIEDNADTEVMNHLSVCNDWIEEIGEVVDIDYNMNYIPSQSEYMLDVSKAYETDNIGFTGMIDYKLKKKSKIFLLIAGVVFYPLFPIAIVHAFSPSYEYYYYTYIFDAKTGELNVDKLYKMKKKPRDGNVNSYIYDMFETIKLEKK